MDKPTCRTCPYWYAPDPENFHSVCMDSVKGECHRFPPTRDSVDKWRGGDVSRVERSLDEINEADWIDTEESDWCGEHPDFPAYLANRKPEG
jgi:hypothetical protein